MSKHDDKIKQLLSKIETDKKNLGKKPKVSLNTNGLFRFDNSNHFNLNTVSDSGYLVRALGFLLEKETTQREAAKRLGVDDYVFDWKGYSLKDWEGDFKLRADSIVWNARQKKLAALQKQLKTLRSEDAKTDEALGEIEKMLG